jgi:hypothetical protein
VHGPNSFLKTTFINSLNSKQDTLVRINKKGAIEEIYKNNGNERVHELARKANLGKSCEAKLDELVGQQNDLKKNYSDTQLKHLLQPGDTPIRPEDLIFVRDIRRTFLPSSGKPLIVRVTPDTSKFKELELRYFEGSGLLDTNNGLDDSNTV